MAILKPEIKKPFQFDDDGKKRKNFTLSTMLAKTFMIDVTACEMCGGKLKAIAAALDHDSISKYLNEAGLDDKPPPRTPPRFKTRRLEFDDQTE